MFIKEQHYKLLLIIELISYWESRRRSIIDTKSELYIKFSDNIDKLRVELDILCNAATDSIIKTI